jgi:hypothetical protein
MYYREGNIDRDPDTEQGPMSARSSLVDIVHKALYHRAETLLKEHPGARVDHEFEDDEPRGVLWLLGKDGNVLTKEFIESVFSAGKRELDLEYIDAARRYGRLAIHYPGLIMPEGSVIKRISELWVGIQEQDVRDKVTIKGFRYSNDGSTMQEV